MKDKIEISEISKNGLNHKAKLTDGRIIKITYSEYQAVYEQFHHDSKMFIERDIDSVSFSDQKIVAKYTNKTARELTRSEYDQIQEEFYKDDGLSM